MTAPAIPPPPVVPASVVPASLAASPALPVPDFSTPAFPEAADPLTALRDIHLPADVPFWPLAPGWVGLIAMVVLVLLILVVREWLWRQTIAYQAMKEFDTLARDGRHNDPQVLAAAASGVLRRLAHARTEAVGVAVFTGEAWTAFLNSGKAAFSAEMATFLGAAPYLPPGSAQASGIERRRLVAAVRRWIRARA